ncbi:hypothetical protein MRB53_008284 [Persea americana]|uniref:Uncharacterized protein n=1 Tax=Persea americana TaxID=3435 RepID=A0ACC2MMA0_PERAE|nr:hypothetical protein MRB53_008284 [Persea americana]
MPTLLTNSEKKIRAGMDFYVSTLKWMPSEVASDSILLTFSLEERPIPRSRVWKMLREKKIKAGMDFYVNKLKWKPSEIVSVPILLMVSLEERVVPRSKVWKMLKCKGLVNEGELKKMLMLSEERFLRKYVTAYEKQVPNLLKAYNSREMYNFSCGMVKVK